MNINKHHEFTEWLIKKIEYHESVYNKNLDAYGKEVASCYFKEVKIYNDVLREYARIMAKPEK